MGIEKTAIYTHPCQKFKSPAGRNSKAARMITASKQRRINVDLRLQIPGIDVLSVLERTTLREKLSYVARTLYSLPLNSRQFNRSRCFGRAHKFRTIRGGNTM